MNIASITAPVIDNSPSRAQVPLPAEVPHLMLVFDGAAKLKIANIDSP